VAGDGDEAVDEVMKLDRLTTPHLCTWSEPTQVPASTHLDEVIGGDQASTASSLSPSPSPSPFRRRPRSVHAHDPGYLYDAV
jgi:hypothetical protein